MIKLAPTPIVLAALLFLRLPDLAAVQEARRNPAESDRLRLASVKILTLPPDTLIGSAQGVPRTGSLLQSPVSERGTSSECDGDWDGAFLGAAIGMSPLVVSLFTSGPGDGVPLGFKLGFVGGIAGFWIGLGLDSRNCVEPS